MGTIVAEGFRREAPGRVGRVVGVAHANTLRCLIAVLHTAFGDEPDLEYKSDLEVGAGLEH